jgi:hypothetical protein
MAIVVAIVGICWSIVAFAVTYPQHRSHTNAFRLGSYSSVEGVVEEFVPMPINGHGSERFRIGTRLFTYEQGNITTCFHGTQPGGGPIREGVRLRVAFVRDPAGKACILKGRDCALGVGDPYKSHYD